MKCIECGAELTSRRETRRYDCGLDDVVLRDVAVRHCPRCGTEEVVIPRVEELNRLIAVAVADKAARLVPKEIRFLRTWLGLSGVDFARRMGVTPESVSRWERVENPLAMKVTAERLLRLMVLTEKPVKHYSPDRLDALATEQAAPLGLRLVPAGRTWRSERPA